MHTHRYNFNPWWLRNKVVRLSTSTPYWKALFFLPILYQTFVFAVTPLWRRSLYLLYPVTLVRLAASWVIEARYYITPLLLFLLFRKPEARETETDLEGRLRTASYSSDPIELRGYLSRCGAPYDDARFR